MYHPQEAQQAVFALLADPAALGRLVERHRERVVPAVDVREGLVVSRGTSLTLGPVADVLRAAPVLREAPLLLVADASREVSDEVTSKLDDEASQRRERCEA